MTQIRPIRRADDPAIAAIIRSVMPEFGADGPGFAIHDPEVAAMSKSYAAPGAAYFVVEQDGRVLGGAGVAALSGAEPGICELRKMYFLPELRGSGIGRRLLRHCLEQARSLGYMQCYIETLHGMNAAQALYESEHFRRLEAAMGSTGHFGCNRFYLRNLD
jgi:putative acetyltransferase